MDWTTILDRECWTSGLLNSSFEEKYAMLIEVNMVVGRLNVAI